MVAISGQPANVNARTLSCASFIYYYGGAAPSGAYTLQYECGGLNGIGCYRGPDLNYYTFDCVLETPGGPGCDADQCRGT